MSGMTPSSPLRPRWACSEGTPGSTPCSMPTPAPTSPAAAIPAPPSSTVRRVGTPVSLPVDELGGTSARRGRPVVMSRKTLLVPLAGCAVTACARHAVHRWLEPVEISAAEAPAPAPVAVLRSWDAQRAEAWARGDPRRWRPSTRRARWRAGTTSRCCGPGRTRGLVVRGLRTQLLAVARAGTHAVDLDAAGHRPARGWSRGRARRAADRSRATGPPPGTVRLRLVGGAWRVASVRPEEVMPQAD